MPRVIQLVSVSKDQDQVICSVDISVLLPCAQGMLPAPQMPTVCWGDRRVNHKLEVSVANVMTQVFVHRLLRKHGSRRVAKEGFLGKLVPEPSGGEGGSFRWRGRGEVPGIGTTRAKAQRQEAGPLSSKLSVHGSVHGAARHV